MTLAVILGRFAIARLFFGEAVERAEAAVIDLTAMLLMVGATFFIADGIQTVAAGSLRGMNDTRIRCCLPRDQLLADRIYLRLLDARLSAPNSARPASGSGCPAAPRCTPCC